MAALDDRRPGPGPPRVLLVDDLPLMRQAVRALLEDAGVPVVGEAGDGRTGVELAQRVRPDVVVMDLRMAHMGGFEATRRLRALHTTAQVVIFTASTGPGLEQAARSAGAFGLVAKGGAPDLLLATVLRAHAAR